MQKNTVDAKAFVDGLTAAKSGLPRTAPETLVTSALEAWLDGWDSGQHGTTPHEGDPPHLS